VEAFLPSFCFGVVFLSRFILPLFSYFFFPRVFFAGDNHCEPAGTECGYLFSIDSPGAPDVIASTEMKTEAALTGILTPLRSAASALLRNGLIIPC